MDTVHTVPALRSVVRELRTRGKRIAFVPTMGHLHGGHQDLVRRARQLGDYVIASIFVNPTQFAEGEDYSSYPRTPEADARKLTEAGTDVLFAPETSEIYPHGFEGTAQVEVPGLSDILCGAYRQGHFRGVTTVVSILFHLVQPDVAVFGEKDYQQLVVIRRMAQDLWMPVRVVGVPTTREPDGLAMSSRNSYLTEEERRHAPLLYRTLCAACDALQRGETDHAALESRCMQALGEGGFRPEYFSVRRRADLGVAGPGESDLVIVAAAWLGRARLIDNVACAG